MTPPMSSKRKLARTYSVLIVLAAGGLALLFLLADQHSLGRKRGLRLACELKVKNLAMACEMFKEA